MSEGSCKHTWSEERTVISASRRTDIPAFYSQWFMNRVRAGFAAVPNPNNAHAVSWRSLSPRDVTAIVFWTRNAEPLLAHLSELDERGYHYYFQYTLTRYPEWLEPRTPGVDAATETMKRLSERLGPHRVVWRYDPIFCMPGLDLPWHLRAIDELAARLSGSVERCVISFLDVFRKTKSNMVKAVRQQQLGDFAADEFSRTDLHAFGEGLAEISARYGVAFQSCAEPAGLLQALGSSVVAGKCIDDGLLRRMGLAVDNRKDQGQREACNCVASREIGMYDSCQHGCAYCYATVSGDVAIRNARARHDSRSASLLGFMPDGLCPRPAQTSLL